MSKYILYSGEAKTALKRGVDKLARAVVTTLGPSGRNVFIEPSDSDPTNTLPQSTKDGVTVAKSIEFPDRAENLGAQLVKQASIKTNEQAGDGTTTSTLLAKEFYEAGLEILSQDRNISVVDVKKSLDKLTANVVEELIKNSKDITDQEQLKQVATISANNDKEVGTLIATAIDKVGQDGIISIEESRTGQTVLDVVEGIQFDRGYKSPYFVTDNRTRQAILKDPYILITDMKIVSVKPLLPILERVSQKNKSLLIIADDIDGEALSTLVVNKSRGNLKVAAVRAPEFGDRKRDVLEDIADLTGGTVVSAQKGHKLDAFDTNWFGECGKVTVGKDTTTIIDAKGDPEVIERKITDLKELLENTKIPYEVEKLQERLGAIVGGVAVINVGGMTEIQMKETKFRVDDALHATRAAIEEGIQPGGGTALLKIANQLEGQYPSRFIDALKTPFRQILINAGYSDESIKALERTVSDSEYWEGVNVRDREEVNLFDKGIFDPTKVTRLALENAASVAGTMLITETVILNVGEKEEQVMDPMAAMAGLGM